MAGFIPLILCSIVPLGPLVVVCKRLKREIEEKQSLFRGIVAALYGWTLAAGLLGSGVTSGGGVPTVDKDWLPGFTLAAVTLIVIGLATTRWKSLTSLREEIVWFGRVVLLSGVVGLVVSAFGWLAVSVGRGL